MFYITNRWYGPGPWEDKPPEGPFPNSSSPSALLRTVCNEISWAYSLWRCFPHLVAKGQTPITWLHTTGMTMGLLPIPAYQVLLSGVNYCVLEGLSGVWWQSPPESSCKPFLLEYITLINFRHCLRCSWSSPGTIWMCSPMRFWPRTPELFEIKLPMNLDIAIYTFLGQSKAQSNFCLGTGLCLSIMWNGRKENAYWFLHMYTFLWSLKKFF